MVRRDFIRQTGIVLGGTIGRVPSLERIKNTAMEKNSRFDVVIVGGSYAGLAAGMALGRALRNVLVIDSGAPCNKQTPQSHNFLTNDGKPPKEIAGIAKQQVQKYGNVVFVEDFAVSAFTNSHGFEIETAKGQRFTGRKLVLATGIKDIMPTIPGFAESWGISVLHCPYCHGYEVKSRKTGILANGDTAYELSSLISNWTSDLTVYTDGKSLLTEMQKGKLRKHQIKVVEAGISSLETRKGYIQSILLADGTKAPIQALYARLPFTQHSSIPAELGCELTQEGYIRIDGAQKTTVPGVYACGDNTTRMRTVANAVSMGTATGMMVNKELIEADF